MVNGIVNTTKNMTTAEYKKDIQSYSIEELAREITNLRKYVRFMNENPKEDNDMGWTLFKLNICYDDMNCRLNGKAA